MKQIYIKTTESCNLKCKHCYINDFRKDKRIFDCYETMNWIDSYIKEFNIDTNQLVVCFHGGEPFLAPLSNIEYCCKKLKEIGIKYITATSNLCFNIREDFINLVKNYFMDLDGNPLIKTSWDYFIRFDNDKQEELWEENVKELVSNGINVHVNICLTSKLIREVSTFSLLKKLNSLKVSGINFERLTSNTTVNVDLIPDYKEQNLWLNQFYIDNKDTYRIPVTMFDTIRETIRSGNLFGCNQRHCMEKVITINADGSIGGCPNTSLINKFSSIEKEPSDLRKNSCRLCLIKKEQEKNPKCFLCSFYQFCNGDCHQLEWKDGICPAPISIYQQIFKEESKRVNNIDQSYVDMEDLIINRFENQDDLLPQSILVEIENPVKGNLVPLMNNCRHFVYSFNMDEAYNLANLLFIKDPTETNAIYNRLNRVFYLPSFYKELLSANPKKRFSIDTLIIERRDEFANEPNFIFPNKVFYRKFNEVKYGRVEIDGKNIMYYCMNIPKEYYIKHYKYFDHLLYDIDKNEYISNNKKQDKVQELINSIAMYGFNTPLLFYVNQSGMLKGICNKTRLMIARYLDLPSIPAIIVLGDLPDAFPQSSGGNCKELAEKFLSPYIVLPEETSSDLLLEYTEKDTIAYSLLNSLPQDLLSYLLDNYLIKKKDIVLQKNSCKGSIFEDGSYLMWNELYHDYFYYNFGIFERELEYKIIKLTDIMGKMKAECPRNITMEQRRTLNKLKKKIYIEEKDFLPMVTWSLD